MLSGLDPRSTRVGLVCLRGRPVESQRARECASRAFTVEGLTRDYARIESGLDELFSTGPEGMTFMAAGVDQATIELMGLRGAYSKKDPDSEKITFFFTDGQPTLPYPDRDADNVRAVLRAANRAHRGHIRIHSFAIGPEALEGPIAAVEMASRTRGYFTPVRDPGDLVDIVEDVSFADIEKVTLEHAGTRVEAHPFRLTADGSWAGFVKLSPGSNPIQATAVAAEGASAKRRIQCRGRRARELLGCRRLVVQRNRLLEMLRRQAAATRPEREAQESRARTARDRSERPRRRAARRAAKVARSRRTETTSEAGRNPRSAMGGVPAAGRT